MVGLKLLLAGFLVVAIPEISPRTEPVRVTNDRGTTVVFSAPENGTNEYISRRHEVLDHLALEDPARIMKAQLSFSTYVTANDLLDTLSDTDISPLFLNIGRAGQAGGFELREGEGLAAGLARLNASHAAFLETVQEGETSAEATTGRVDARRKKHEAHVKTLSWKYEKRGVLFVGALVTGPLISLQGLRDQSPIIRLVDPYWDDLSDTSGLTETRKVSAPIVP